MLTNRCKTEDHLIDPDATSQDSAQALLDEAPHRPVPADTIARWVATIERAEVNATENRTLSFQRLAVHLRAQLLDEMKAADNLRAKLAEIEAQEPAAEVISQQRNAIYTVRTMRFDLPAGSFLFAAPAPTQGQASYRKDYPTREQDLGHEIEKARADEKRLGVGFLVNGWYVPARLVSAFRPVPAQAVPDGWRLVPVEITEVMHAAAVKTIARCSGNADFPSRVWCAMIAAYSETQLAQLLDKVEKGEK